MKSFNPVPVTNWSEQEPEPLPEASELPKSLNFERAFFAAIGFAALFLCLGAAALVWMI